MKIGLISKKITSYYRRDRSKLHITSRRDWNIILMIIFLSLLASFSYSYYIYIDTVVYGEKEVLTENKTQEISDIEKFKTELDETFTYFENKRQYHEKLLLKKKDFMGLVVEKEASTTVVEEEANEGEATSFLDTFLENVSNGAVVWKSIFIDLFK